MSAFILTFAITICSAIIWYYVKYIRIYWKYPKVFIWPVILNSILKRDIPKNMSLAAYYWQTCLERFKQFQSEGLFVFWLIEPVLFIYDQDMLKLISNDRSAINKPPAYHRGLGELVSNSLVIINDDVWRKRRKMYNPAFYPSPLRNKTATVNRNAVLLVEDLMELSKEPEVDIMNSLKIFAFRTAFKSIFDLDFSDPDLYTEAQRGFETLNELCEITMYKTFRPWLYYKRISKCFSKQRRFLELRKQVREFAHKILEKIKDSFLANKSESENESNEIPLSVSRSVAHILVDQHLKDPSLDMETMIDDILLFTSASHDTVSLSLMWCIYLIGLHPDVQEQVYNEVDSVMHDQTLSFDDLPKLTYMDCVLKETFRLYTTIPFYLRILKKTLHCGKYSIPKDTVVALCPYLQNRNPDIYPDPEKFDPERFFEENSYSKTWQSLMPFSEGLRNCIGKNFALMEMKIVLSHLVKNFKIISLNKQEDIAMIWEITLKTMDPLLFRLVPRK